MIHAPVLKKEVLEFLSPQSGQIIVDCTLGLGGHSLEILKMLGDSGKLIGFDLDEKNLAEAEKRLERFSGQTVFINKNFRFLQSELSNLGFEQVDGILLDLGLSSPHVDDPARGFSFREKGELCMRYDKRTGISAYDTVNEASQEELARIFWEYGQEKRSRIIAGKIVEARKSGPIETTTDLAEIIRSISKGKTPIDPATRVFQALRIYVNDEINVLKEVLPQALNYLKIGGRMVVISYHSLEDRIVKHFFKEETRECICPRELPICSCNHKPSLKILTKKPITPSDVELTENRRSRSAKLRAIEKL